MFLDTLHRYSKKWVFKILLILVCSSFVIFGLADVIMRFINDKPVAKIGKNAISREEVARRINQETARILQQSKNKIDPQILLTMGLHQKILDELIDEKAIIQFYHDLKLAAPDRVVREMIQSIPTFQKDGVYNPELSRSILRAQNISDVRFSEQIKQFVYTQQLEGTLAASLELPKIYIDTLTAAVSETLTYKIAKIHFDSAEPKDKISDETLKIYFNKNKENYKTPETRTFDYVVFDEQKMSSKIPVSDEAIKERFEQQKTDFAIPESRLVVKISAPTETLALDAQSQLQKGVPIKQVSEKIRNVSFEDIGLVERDTLPQKSSEAVFALHEGEYSSVIKNGNIFVVYKVEKINPEQVKSFNEVKDLIKENLQLEKFAAEYQLLRDSFEDSLAAGLSLEETAKKFNIEFIASKTLNKVEKKDIDTTTLKNLSEELQNAITENVFSKDENSESRIIDVSPKYSIAIHVKNIKESKFPDFEVVKEKVLGDYQLEEKRKIVLKRVSEIVKTSDNKESFVSNLQKNKIRNVQDISFKIIDLESKEYMETQNGKYIKELPKAVVKKMLSTAVGNCSYAEIDENTVIVFFHVVDQKNEIEPKFKESMIKNINTLVSNDTKFMVTTAARKRLALIINKEILDSITNGINYGD